MSDVIVLVDAERQRVETKAMCDRANATAMRRVFGEEASRRFTLRLMPLTGRVVLHYGVKEPYVFVSVRAALAYVGAMQAVGEYVDSDGISGQYRIKE